jgi:hypothetical protein
MSTDARSQDFDFFLGDWHVEHRRLRERLTGCTEWQHFDGLCSTRALLSGLGNVDDNLVNLPEGAYRAATLRAFDPVTRQWAIWWLDARQPHQLDVPVVGGFKDGVGLFYADDSLHGQAIRVRFAWTDTRSDAPCWEQAFSPDGGLSWEVNWVMRFHRRVPG